jgi:dimethylaniline monooxygenase (N-oxide forming)
VIRPQTYTNDLQYVDTLFNDLGLEAKRKSNYAAELFSPYGPGDYSGFIDEYLAKNPGVLGRKDDVASSDD